MSKKMIALVVLVIAVVLAAIIANFSKPAQPQISAQKYNIPEENDYSFGAANAPRLTIVEFADFACPYCRDSFPTVRELGIKYQDSVKIIFKDFPLHDSSLDLAMAGRCAGAQGLFWPLHDKLFAAQGQFATGSLPSLAVSIGANGAVFTDCLKTKKYLNDIKRDFLDGQALGVTGTPTFFFNGYKLAGEIPKSDFEKIIKEFLK